MSSAAAIAASTATLARMLRRATKGIVVTRPLLKARKDRDNPYLNVSLYHIAIDPTLRNNPDATRRPGVTRPDGALVFPLPVDLYYLVSAFPAGETDDAEIQSHRLLGHAMAFLHDHPVWNRSQIHSMLSATGSGNETLLDDVIESGLEKQIERISITFQPLTDDEMSKLWTAAQAGYTPSAAYRVAVVIIESELTGSAPVPVLRRGAEDRGVIAVPGASIPELRQIKVPAGIGIAFGGEQVEFLGTGFSNDPASPTPVRVRLRTVGSDAEVLLDAAADSTAERVIVKLDPATVRAGVQSAAILVQRSSKVLEQGAVKTVFRAWASSELPLAVAPKLLAFLKTDGSPIEAEGGKPFREIALVAGELPLRIVSEPRLMAKGENGLTSFIDAVELLLDGIPVSGPVQPDVLADGKTELYGTPARPLRFAVPITFADIAPTAQEPDRNVRSIRLRVNGVELPKIKTASGQPPEFDYFVRILP